MNVILYDDVPLIAEYCLVNYGVVQVLVVASSMAGSTTGVLMSPGYGGYQAATLPPYYTTRYATTSYYTAVT